MLTNNDTSALALNVTPLQSGKWGNYWAPNVPFTTNKGTYYYGYINVNAGSYKPYSWFTEEFTQIDSVVSGMGDETDSGAWQEAYTCHFLLGGTGEPLWARYSTSKNSVVVQQFNADGTMGDQISQFLLKDSSGNACSGTDFTTNISNVPNQLTTNVFLADYSLSKIYFFDYNEKTVQFDCQSESNFDHTGIALCAYQVGSVSVVLVPTSYSSKNGYSVEVFSSDGNSGGYTKQDEITFPKQYGLLKPVVSNGDMYLLCIALGGPDYDIFYLDPTQGGLPGALVDSGQLTENYTTGIIGYDSSNNPFVYMQAKDTYSWGMYTFEAGAAPEPDRRPIPPEIDGVVADKTWGTTVANCIVTVTMTLPGGSPKKLKPVSADSGGNWQCNFDTQATKDTIVSATASLSADGKPSDAFVSVMGYSQSGFLYVDSVRETEVIGRAPQTGQIIKAWRSSDGTKMVDYTMPDNQMSFDITYLNSLTLADDDQLNVVSADADNGSMTIYTSRPEGYPGS